MRSGDIPLHSRAGIGLDLAGRVFISDHDGTKELLDDIISRKVAEQLAAKFPVGHRVKVFDANGFVAEMSAEEWFSRPHQEELKS